MQSSDIPLKLPKPFGANAGGSYIRTIPVASQIGVVDGAASLTDGFPPLNFQPIAAGGVPPSGKDLNGILFEVSGWARWVAAGGPVFFDADFAAAIGGYMRGAVVLSASDPTVMFVSTAENNGTNPESGSSAGWATLGSVPATLVEMRAGTVTNKFATPATIAALRATPDDVRAGLDTAMYISPASLAAMRATPSDVRAGTDAAKFVTPAALAAVNVPGVTYLPGGLIMQQGAFLGSISEGPHSLNFNTSFPNTLENVILTLIFSGRGNRLVYWNQAASNLNGFAYDYEDTEGSGAANGISWLAFGR